MKTTILEYISSMGDGGAETLVKDYALLLDKEQYDVRILITRPYPGTANTKLLEENKIPVLCIYPKWNLSVRIFNKLFGRWYRPYRVQRIVKQLNVDVLHAHINLLGTLSPIRKSLKDVHLLYTCHSLPSVMIGGPGNVEFEAAKVLIRDNNLQMIALHGQMKKEIDSMFGITNTEIVRNGIQMNRFIQVKETREEVRQRLGIPADMFVVGHVGRFSKAKNHSFLLDIFSEIKNRNPNAHLMLIGTGELKSQVQENISQMGLQESVTILSNRSDVPQLLKAMDVFVFPSIFEGLPVSLIEAQAAGLRCIVSDVITEEAFVTDQVVALSVTEDPKKWARLACDDTIRGSCENRLMDFDMNQEIKRLEAMYLK